MSLILVVHCDYNDGECLGEFNGFTPNVEVSEMNEILCEMGWTINGSNHFCPNHNYALKDKPKIEAKE